MGLPDVTVLMATQDDDCRKPKSGMWTFFVDHLNGGVAPSARPAPLGFLALCGQQPPRQL